MAAFLPAAATAVASFIGNKLSSSGGSRDRIKKMPTMSGRQTKFFNSFLQQAQGLQGGGYQQAIGQLQGMLDPNSQIYKDFAAPQMREFNEQTIPGIAERFAGAGGGMGALGGALSSSGFGQALGAAGAGLNTNLAQLRAQLQQQAIQSILGQYNQSAQTAIGAQPFAYGQRQGTQGAAQAGLGSFFSNLTPGAMQGGYNSLSNFFGGGGGGAGSSLANNQTFNELSAGFKSGAIPFQ